MKKIISLLLAVLMLLGIMCGCKNENSSTETQQENDSVVLTRENLASYTIVVSDRADEETKKVADNLKQKMKTITGTEPKVKSDFVVEGSTVYCEEELEILFGVVDRAGIDELYADIRENDSGYTMIGKKVVLIGYNSDALKKSYSLFLSDILQNAESKTSLMTSGDEKIVAGTYSYDKMQLNGVAIEEYKIIYPAVAYLQEKTLATSIAAYIKRQTGYTMTCESDKSEVSAHEIQVGQTNRITDTLLAQRDGAGYGDGKCCIVPTENGIWLSANNEKGLVASANRFYELFEVNGKVADMQVSSAVSYQVKTLSVSTMTYNVLYDFSANRNPDHVLQSIETENTDVFGCNEVTDEWITRLTAKFNSTYTCVKGLIRSNDKSAEYCPIFFKTAQFELVESGTKWMSDTPDRMSKYKESHVYRIFTYAVLKDKTTGVTFMYIQAHLENNMEGYDSVSARTKQSAVLKKFTDSYATLPIIVSGDMNSNNLKDISPLLQNTRFTNSVSIAEEKIESGTWVGKGFDSIADYTLDYIFVTEDSIEIKKYEAVDNKIEGKYPSDHIPVRIDAVIYQ